ncbi:MAG: glycosyltransferase [Ruminococcaceae bacterium]|nr:glycosyltransferase [Oscillospiraceae bacterium]
MMMETKFSVAISVYEKENAVFFNRALESITEIQTVKPSEIVLVVDGPIDDELDAVITKYEKKYDIFKVIRLSKNVGLGNALKIAIENSSYELIARMDSDDVALPSRFEEQLRAFKENDKIDIVGGDISEFIGEEKNIVAYRRVPCIDDEIKKYLKKRCPFNHMSVMYKKSSVDLAGGYMDLFWNEDYYLWIRMALQGAVMANTGTVLVNVRTGSDMYKRRGGKKYFQSEKFLQKYMLNHAMINRITYIENMLKRWIIQRLLPNSLRGVVFRTLARKK